MANKDEYRTDILIQKFSQMLMYLRPSFATDLPKMIFRNFEQVQDRVNAADVCNGRGMV